MVVSAPLDSDVAGAAAARLTRKIAQLVAGRLGSGARFESEPRTLDELLGAAAKKSEERGRRSVPGFVHLTPKIERGRLHVAADAHPVRRTVWSRALSRGEPGPVAHAFAQAPIDAEVRSYLPAISWAEPTVTKFDGADPDVLALACGDLDADASPDVVLMTRQRVLSIRLKDGKVERAREARWAELAPVAPVPLRQPLGFLTIVEAGPGAPRGYLDAAISDRMGSVRLDPELGLALRMQGKAVPLGRGTGCTWMSELRLGERLVACGSALDAVPLAELTRKSDAIASTVIVEPTGRARTVTALRDQGALVTRGDGEEKIVGRVGAQLAIADLDQDGAPEIATTVDVLSPKHDALEVRTLMATGTVQRRYRVAVPTGVEALAACPPDAGGVAALVLATHGEVWVVR